MKKIIAVLISLGMLVSFSGCGNSESQNELTYFVHADIFSYMFLKNQFVFFDFEQSAVSAFAEYTAMMSFWVFIGYYIAKGIKKLLHKKSEPVK